LRDTVEGDFVGEDEEELELDLLLPVDRGKLLCRFTGLYFAVLSPVSELL
jgi:hypothetical protein